MTKEKKKINKNTILIFVSVPILVVIGVIAGNYFAHSDTQLIGSSEAQTEQIEEETVLLDEFILNLEPGNNTGRFVRMEVSLSTVQEDGVATIETNLDKIRDAIIHTMSTQTIEQLFNDENGTLALKNLLKTSINDNLDADVIYDVYIRNIVMQ